MLTLLQGVAAKAHKVSSLKRMLVLGAVAGIPGNYFNVKTIMDQLNMEALEFTISLDIKMHKKQ